MKKFIYPLTCLTLLFTNPSRGDDLPFFSSLRQEITIQLTLASNTPPLNKKLINGLQANLKLIDRTKPTLLTGGSSLGTLAKSLSKTSLSNTFLPILIDTRAAYIDAMETEISALMDQLADTIPGKARSAAQTAIGKVLAVIENVKTNASLAGSLGSLKKAATALVAAEKAVVKAETAPPGPNFLTATVTESNQGTFTFMPTKKTILDAYYDEFSGEIDIDAGNLRSLEDRRAHVGLLSIVGIVPGEGTYTLSLTNVNQGYATYESAIVPDIKAPEPDLESYEFYATVDPINRRLGTGTLTITVDLEANIVWGEFAFTATGSEDSDLQVRMTGSFLVRLEMFE